MNLEPVTGAKKWAAALSRWLKHAKHDLKQKQRPSTSDTLATHALVSVLEERKLEEWLAPNIDITQAADQSRLYVKTVPMPLLDAQLRVLFSCVAMENQ